ncbi:MAG: hypothetical protein ABSC41_07195 [Acidimicrobiales bacterium]
MFVTPTDRPPRDQGVPGPGGERAREPLALLAERTRPVSSSQTQLLSVVPPLADLFPDGSLRRGSTIAVTGPAGHAGGGVSLTLALLAAASGAGCWCALVGLPGLGAVASHDLGIDLSRLAVVPRPGTAWAEVAAALIDGVDLVVLCPPFPPRPAMARRLVARARERRSVLVVTGRHGWPERPDVELKVGDARWDGVGAGEGYLRRRRMTVTATGRRSSARPRHRHLWLPTPTGAVADAAEDPVVPA